MCREQDAYEPIRHLESVLDTYGTGFSELGLSCLLMELLFPIISLALHPCYGLFSLPLCNATF